MRRECRERFPRCRLQRKPLISDLGTHHAPWCMSGSLTRGGGENVPGIRGACATRNFTYLARCPWTWSDRSRRHDTLTWWYHNVQGTWPIEMCYWNATCIRFSHNIFRTWSDFKSKLKLIHMHSRDFRRVSVKIQDTEPRSARNAYMSAVLPNCLG